MLLKPAPPKTKLHIMASVELASSPVQNTSFLNDQQKETLDDVLRPHLRLEPNLDEYGHTTRRIEGQGVSFTKSNSKTTLEAGTESQHKQSRPTVHQSTIETDNKKRPGIMKRNSIKYQPLPPELPDPNSEVKSVVIKRMHGNLEDWNKQLVDIAIKKKRNDDIQKNEIDKRDDKIDDLTTKLNNETKVRSDTELERDELSEQLENRERQLKEQTQNVEELSAQLIQYEIIYQETESRRQNLEQENAELTEKLFQIEEMKRRLNDQVTDLQGQVSMLERRSAICRLL